MPRHATLLPLLAAAALLTPAAPVAAKPIVDLPLQRTKPITKSSAAKIGAYSMSRSAIYLTSESTRRDFGVRACKVTKAGKQATCNVALAVEEGAINGKLTIVPGYGRSGGRAAITSFKTTFELAATCNGGSCGTAKTLDVTGALSYRWNAAGKRYVEVARSIRQEQRK